MVWIRGVQDAAIEGDLVEQPSAWDDVHGGQLPIAEVKAARQEEVEYMQARGIWKVVPLTMC